MSIDELAGFEFSGWNRSLVPKIGGFRKFIFWRLVRDLLVKIDGDPDLLLGRVHLALGPWLFAGYFLLKRRRPHAYTGA